MPSSNVTYPAAAVFSDVVPIVPSDTTLISNDATNNPSGYKFVRLFVVATGTVSFKALESNVTITLTAVPANTLLPFLTNQVMAATTATVVGGIGRFKA